MSASPYILGVDIGSVSIAVAAFAKTDLVHAQQEGCTLVEICDGLCLGLARNIFETLFTAQDILGPIIFTGGVSLNRSVVEHLRSLTGEDVITARTLVHGAIGAALCLAETFPALAPSGFQSVEDIRLQNPAL